MWSKSPIRYIVVQREQYACRECQDARRWGACTHRLWSPWDIVNTTTANLSSAKSHASRIRNRQADRNERDPLVEVKILTFDIDLLLEVTADAEAQFVATEAVMIAANDKLAAIDKQLRMFVEPTKPKRKRRTKPADAEGGAA